MSHFPDPMPLVGVSPSMKEVSLVIDRVARNHSTVLIRGASGTGKELVARLIHQSGLRAAKPFMAINCGSIAPTLLESELFGHVKGAFTGANSNTLGFFRAAEGGTIFLDEITEIPPDLQVKLLRVLQEREVTPVGSSDSLPVDVRVIAATNRDLDQALRTGALRSDLYYRLNVVGISLPALKDHPADLPHLVEHFLRTYAAEYSLPRKSVHPDVMRVFFRYPWPGNVRELENVIERSYALDLAPEILPRHLPDQMLLAPEVLSDVPQGPVPTLEQVERLAIVQALAAASGKRSLAADFLGIHRNRLARRIRYFNL